MEEYEFPKSLVDSIDRLIRTLHPQYKNGTAKEEFDGKAVEDESKRGKFKGLSIPDKEPAVSENGGAGDLDDTFALLESMAGVVAVVLLVAMAACGDGLCDVCGVGAVQLVVEQRLFQRVPRTRQRHSREQARARRSTGRRSKRCGPQTPKRRSTGRISSSGKEQ